MRKRFISGLTAVCMLGILLANSFLAVPASAVIAEVGASVAAGLLMGTLFNQMTGGTGYDFTDAFADCFGFVVTPHNQFIRDNPDADIYLPDGTPYYVDGQYAAAIELKKGEAEITKMVQSHWNIAESLGLKTPQEAIHSALEVLNKGLADGSIVIHVDDDGNISMPTESYCTIVDTIYSNFGVITSNNGLKRSQTVYNFISPYIDSVCYGEYSYSTSRQLYAVPFVITTDGLFCPNMRFSVISASIDVKSWNSWFGSSVFGTPPCCTHYNWSSDDFDYNTTVYFNSDFTVFTVESVCLKDSHSDKTDFDLSNRKSSDGKPITYSISGTIIDYSNVKKSGFFFIGNTVNDYNNFLSAYKSGEISYKVDNQSISLTDVEQTILDMGLSGIGSGATKGTVSVDSKTKDITVTNEATKEAELVVEQGNPGDIDIPDNDTIIDKFPFSLPFDLYRILTIFVVPEQKPIFKFPIETTITNGGLNYKIDEEIEVDLTRFQFMGQDIVRLVLRSTFYVGFVIMLIHVTSKFIKH